MSQQKKSISLSLEKTLRASDVMKNSQMIGNIHSVINFPKCSRILTVGNAGICLWNSKTLELVSREFNEWSTHAIKWDEEYFLTCSEKGIFFYLADEISLYLSPMKRIQSESVGGCVLDNRERNFNNIYKMFKLSKNMILCIGDDFKLHVINVEKDWKYHKTMFSSGGDYLVSRSDKIRGSLKKKKLFFFSSKRRGEGYNIFLMDYQKNGKEELIKSIRVKEGSCGDFQVFLNSRKEEIIVTERKIEGEKSCLFFFRVSNSSKIRALEIDPLSCLTNMKNQYVCCGIVGGKFRMIDLENPYESETNSIEKNYVCYEKVLDERSITSIELVSLGITHSGTFSVKLILCDAYPNTLLRVLLVEGLDFTNEVILFNLKQDTFERADYIREFFDELFFEKGNILKIKLSNCNLKLLKSLL